MVNFSNFVKSNAIVQALNTSQAIIEFELDGTIITANENFLQTMGYTLDEVKGQHHKMFADPEFAQSQDYKDFWKTLRAGQYIAAQYQRFGKGGKEIWIQASYNPILDMRGKPFKVVKFASDITEQMAARIESTERSAQAKQNVQTVASATEEMVASVQEISQSMVKSKDLIIDIIQKNEAAATLTTQLQENTKSMEGIAGLIRDISEQVNLLALNATIEAARAGEAGKGFAVVAGEVKSLANETAKATDQISEQIERIQGIANDVYVSGDTIAKSTNAVSEYINSIVAAIEEQTAVSGEVSANMQKISESISGLDDCISRISEKS